MYGRSLLKGKFICGTLLIHGLVWKILFIIFLSVGHCNFVFFVYGTLAVSPGHFFQAFLFVGHCAVSHKQIHKIRVCWRPKQVEKCFLHQTTNEGCPVDKFTLLKLSIFFVLVLWTNICFHIIFKQNLTKFQYYCYYYVLIWRKKV
jgi:hypothetical protein